MRILKNIFSILYNFFPIRLLLLHFKRNHLFLFFWIILFAFTSKSLAGKYGLNYLFLTPEYLGEINFLSYAILGFAIGGFIMAFNIYSYILIAPRFLFIAALSRPFYKFCLNNSIVPLSYIGYYSFLSVQTQQIQEFITPFNSILNLSGFYFGLALFLILSLLFFFKANKIKDEKNFKPRKTTVKTTLQKTDVRWYVKLLLGSKDTVDWYISSLNSIARTRETKHYSKNQLKQILSKNHINATIFELVMLLSIIALSLFGDTEAFFIPAAASLVLAFTFSLMLISALYSWINGWTIPLLIAVLLGFNYITENSQIIDYSSKLIGLEYNQAKSIETGKTISSTLILDRWKEKQNQEKPKLVLMSVSGGGLRASTWVVNVLSTLKDSTNTLSKLHAITGSSGGMIGASYFRENYFINNSSLSRSKLLNNSSKDALNSLAFYLSINDWIFRYKSFRYQDKNYTKERGYIFEKQLEENLSALEKPLSYYKEKEMNAEIPTMIFSPAIISKNQQLIISPIDHEFLKEERYFNGNSLNEIDSVKLSSILRMNSTFPYIMPIVTTPNPDKLNVMDAGLIDNFGIKIMSEYISENKDWINENTSGVILIKIVDKEYRESETNYSPITKLTLPLKFFYANFDLQNKNNNRLLSQVAYEIDDFQQVEFNLGQSDDDISLSWHLTKKEKQDVYNAINSVENRKSLQLLKTMLAE